MMKEKINIILIILALVVGVGLGLLISHFLGEWLRIIFDMYGPTEVATIITHLVISSIIATSIIGLGYVFRDKNNNRSYAYIIIYWNNCNLPICRNAKS